MRSPRFAPTRDCRLTEMEEYAGTPATYPFPDPLQPQYQLRVDEFRVFYDIADQEVQIIAIVTKGDADRWLAEFSQTEP